MIRKYNLAGDWRFTLDPERIGRFQRYSTGVFGGTMRLPGTISAERLSSEISDRLDDCLTDPYRYEGFAWVQRKVKMDGLYNDIENPKIFLYLERARVTSLFVDGAEVGTENSLCTPHEYDITEYVKKAHRENGTPTFELCLLLDNTSYPIAGGHMTSKDTQTNWLGITGSMYIMVRNNIYLENIQVTPEASEGSVHITADICGNYSNYSNYSNKIDTEDSNIKAIFSAESANGQQYTKLQVNNIGEKLDVTYVLGKNYRTWTEHNPATYELKIAIYDKNGTPDVYIKPFGFRELTIKGNKFFTGNDEVFFRGKHDGMLFPLTGAAPCDVPSWIKIFKIAKNYGINLYRFHTCCPPEAAFYAADKVGIYLAPELPFWGTLTKDESQSVSRSVSPVNAYLEREGERILREFGSHPSFAMFSLGNELWGDADMMNEMLGKFKAIYPNIFYTQGSNNFQFMPQIVRNDDYFVGVRTGKNRLFRGSYAACDAPQGFIQLEHPTAAHSYDDIIFPENDNVTAPNNTATEDNSVRQIQVGTGVAQVSVNTDNSEKISGNSKNANTVDYENSGILPEIPIISHEIGQYCMYPDFTEIPKYTGVLKPYNLEIFKERLDEAGLSEWAESYFKASGRFAAETYKIEIETALRSNALSGFHLLDLQDFTGQGTATVGILNALMENKGVITEEEWSTFCAPVVVFATFEKYVYVSGEHLTVAVSAANYSGKILSGGETVIRITASDGDQINGGGESEIFRDSETIRERITSGRTRIAAFDIKLPEMDKPSRLTLEISACGVKNSYRLWMFPDINDSYGKTGNVTVTSNLTDALQVLEKGGKVLFFPEHTQRDFMIPGTYCTDFWNYPMFSSISELMDKPLPIGTLGLLIDNKHPALAGFPSDTYSTPQWYDIVTASCSLILDGMDIKPIVRTIDNVKRNHSLGLIFEAQVERGRLMVCMANIYRLKGNPPAMQLTRSLLDYMNSPAFAPSEQLSGARFRLLFTV